MKGHEPETIAFCGKSMEELQNLVFVFIFHNFCKFLPLDICTSRKKIKFHGKSQKHPQEKTPTTLFSYLFMQILKRDFKINLTKLIMFICI